MPDAELLPELHEADGADARGVSRIVREEVQHEADGARGECHPALGEQAPEFVRVDGAAPVVVRLLEDVDDGTVSVGREHVRDASLLRRVGAPGRRIAAVLACRGLLSVGVGVGRLLSVGVGSVWIRRRLSVGVAITVTSAAVSRPVRHPQSPTKTLKQH